MIDRNPGKSGGRVFIVGPTALGPLGGHGYVPQPAKAQMRERTFVAFRIIIGAMMPSEPPFHLWNTLL
jgi:hypothetical protein